MTGPFDAIKPVPGPEERDQAAAVLQRRRERQQRAADTRRRLLLDAAWAQMGEVGPHSLNMRDLGARAGYTAGALYSYFPSRDHLIAELRQRLLDILKVRVDRAVRAGIKSKAPDPAASVVSADAFERGTLAWWETLAGDPNAMALLLTGQAPGSPDSKGTDLLFALADATQACSAALRDEGLVNDAATSLHRQVLTFGVGMLVMQAESLRTAVGRKAMTLRFVEVQRLWRGAVVDNDNGWVEPEDDGPAVQVDLFGQ